MNDDEFEKVFDDAIAATRGNITSDEAKEARRYMFNRLAGWAEVTTRLSALEKEYVRRWADGTGHSMLLVGPTPEDMVWESMARAPGFAAMNGREYEDEVERISDSDAVALCDGAEMTIPWPFWLPTSTERREATRQEAAICEKWLTNAMRKHRLRLTSVRVDVDPARLVYTAAAL